MNAVPNALTVTAKLDELVAASPTTEPEPLLRYYEARSAWQFIDLAELWRYRELIWIFGLRDLKVRYRQTAIGVAWAVLQPLALMFIFTTLFRLMGQAPATESVSYSAILLCALLPWQLFATTVTQCTHSLVLNRNLITKVYFPRIVLPLSTLLVGLVDFAVACSLLFALAAWHGIVPSWPMLAFPLFAVLAVITSIAFGLWLSALNAIYRDIEFVVPFLLQLGFFMSPVVYETRAVIPESWQAIYSLNPLVAVFDGFRWSLLGVGEPHWWSWTISVATVSALLLSGLWYFRRMERFFADRI
jgi:lipopolysaccharide transport system permease protein